MSRLIQYLDEVIARAGLTKKMREEAKARILVRNTTAIATAMAKFHRETDLERHEPMARWLAQKGVIVK